MAKDQVTGKFGDEDVVLENAATEATLEKLLKAVERQGGSEESQRKQKEEIKKKTEAIKENREELEEHSDALEKSTSKTRGAFDATKQAVLGLTNEFISGSLRISDFSSHITGLINQIPVVGGLIGGPLQLLASVVDNNIDTFRELSTVGISFGTSVMDAQRAATTTGLSLSTFTQGLGQSSESLALLAGNASDGAEVFRAVNQNLQPARVGFSNLGLTLEETTEYVTDFLDMQTRLGRAQRMDNVRLSQQTEDYIMQLDELSKMTGIQREELSKGMQSAAMDKRLQGFLATVEPGIAENIRGVVASLENYSPEIADSVKGLIATGGVPMDEMGRSLLIANRELGPIIAGLRDNSSSVEDVFRALGETSESFSDAQLQQASQLEALGNPILRARLELQQFRNAMEGASDASDEQQKLIQDGQAGLLDFERRLTQARNVIIGTFIDSGVFKMTIAAFESVVDYLTGDGIQHFKDMFDGFANWLNGFVEKIKSDGLYETLKEGAMKAMSMLGGFLVDSLKAILFGGDLDREDQSRREQLESQRRNLLSDPTSSDPDSKAREELNKINQELDMLKNKEEGVLGNLFATLATSIAAGTFGALLIGGGIVAGLKGLSFGLSALGNPKVALGAGVLAGLAYTFGKTVKNVGTGFDLIGDGVTKVKDSLTELSEIRDTATLKDVASSLGVMGTAMDELNDRGFVDQIGALFGRQSPFEQLMEGVKDFASIGDRAVTSIVGTADAISSLSTVNTDLDASPVEDYTEAIKKLTEALDGLNEELADDNNTGFMGRNQNLSAGQLLGGNGSGSGSGSLEELENLNRTMKDILGVLMQGHDVTRKQLTATRSLTGNLYR